ncbi:MAG: ABC transporter ATP-binding protein [Microscillaceae bacterium]|nr:ABC transporter ATP-binding protein [Microscillaceae bacterium]
MAIIRAKSLHKSYGDLAVLKGINLEIEKGEIVAIVGASGAGKSTLLHLLGTLDRPDQGQVWIDEEDVFSLKGAKLAQFRNRHIGFVFQFHNLLPEFNALENVCMPAFLAGVPAQKAQAHGQVLLEKLGIGERATHLPAQMSGGEQQRTAIARALMNSPKVVLADEPSGNLDSLNSQALHRLFFDLRQELEQTFVIVTHNQELADMSDRKILMQDGRLSV